MYLLTSIPGKKFLIEGNHDGSIRAYHNYFKEVYQIKEMRFKPTVAPFLKEDFSVVMCHYPMVTWNQKPRGSVMLHGHSHGKLDEYNAQSMDLRFDVGIDGELANLRFLTLGDRKMWKRPFWDWCAEHFRETFVVPGNHEFYGGFDIGSAWTGFRGR